MKSTGIVRKLDELGRLTLPKELRKTFEINEGDPVEIFVDGEMVCLQKYQQKKCNCGESDTKMLRKWNERYICTNCIMKLVDLLDNEKN